VKCRQPTQIPEEYLKEIGFSEKNVTFYKSVGCKYCNNTGYYGRIAVLEAVLIDDVIREMIIKKQSLDEIKDYAINKAGMKLLRDDVYLKVREGLTTIEEAIRLTTEE
jgi:type IV pilus assembly protein PilB